MDSVADAIKQLREQSKYLHVLSHAHKNSQESGELINNRVTIIDFMLFSTVVSTKNS
jgi:hypothetical protein